MDKIDEEKKRHIMLARKYLLVLAKMPFKIGWNEQEINRVTNLKRMVIINLKMAGVL